MSIDYACKVLSKSAHWFRIYKNGHTHKDFYYYDMMSMKTIFDIFTSNWPLVILKNKGFFFYKIGTMHH